MANSTRIKKLLSNRQKSGPVQSAIIDGIGEKILDPIQTSIEQATAIDDPTATAHERDLNARYGINPPLSGAALADAITSARAAGDPDQLQTELQRFLDANYTFALGSSVTAYWHDSVDGASSKDYRTVSIQVPVEDDNGDPVRTDDASLLAEIRRLIPKFDFHVVHTTTTQSANYVKAVSSEDGKSDIDAIDVLPDNLADVIASGEDSVVTARSPKDVNWIDPQTEQLHAGTVIDGEDDSVLAPVDEEIRIEASSESHDIKRTYSIEIKPPTDLLGGFNDKNPPINNARITAIAAREAESVQDYSIKHDKVSKGENVSVSLKEPLDEHPFTLIQESRLIDNTSKNGKNPIGEFKIFHQHMTRESGELADLAGKTVTLVKQPLTGGSSNKDDILANKFQIFQDLVPLDPNHRTPPQSPLTVDFARNFFKGQGSGELDKSEKVYPPRNRTGTFRLTVGGLSMSSSQTNPQGHAPGFIGIPIKNPASVDGVSKVVGFPQITDVDNQYLIVRKIAAETSSVNVSIVNQIGPGGQIAYSSGLVPFPSKVDVDYLPDAGKCQIFGFNVPNFFDLLSFTGSASPQSVDIKWSITIDVTVVFDFAELQEAGKTSEQDKNIYEWNPPQVFKCTSVDLRQVPGNGFLLNELDMYDVPYQESIVSHRMYYDANNIPKGGVEIIASATYEIDNADDAGTVNIPIPIPRGYKCPTVDIKIQVDNAIKQTITVDIGDPNIRLINGGDPVFKVAHLDSIVEPTESLDLTIATVIVFYKKQSGDMLITADATFANPTGGLVARDIEDLRSITFSTSDAVPVVWWNHNLVRAYTAFFTESATNNLVQIHATGALTPRRITGGIVYYWEEDQPDTGIFLEVLVKYGQYPLGGYEANIAVLSTNVPEGTVVRIWVKGLTTYKLWYVDEDGFYRDYINSFNIRTVEVHFDKTQIPRNGVFLEIWVKYRAGTLTSLNAADAFQDFSANAALRMVSATFVGLKPKRILYDTVEEGHIETIDKHHVRSVKVVFDTFTIEDDKVLVQFQPTYLLPLKEAVFPVRQDWTVENLQIAGSITPVSLWVKGEFKSQEFERFVVGGLTGFKPRRISAVRALYYDEDLGDGVQSNFDLTLTVREIINHRINPFLEGTARWSAPSGLDEQYLVEMDNIAFNRVDIDGDTTTPNPVLMNANGFEEPFVNGQTVQPTYLKLFYKTIRSIRLFFDGIRDDSFHKRQSVLYDNDTAWWSHDTPANETLEIRARDLEFNQLIAELAPGSMVPSKIDFGVQLDTRDFTTVSIIPVVVTISSYAGHVYGSTELQVSSTAGMDAGNILSLAGKDYVRIQRVLSDTQVLVDPINTSLAYGDSIQVVGYDFGDEVLKAGRFLLTFYKGGAAGQIKVRRIWPRIERRTLSPAWARNVLQRNSAEWMSERTERQDGEAKLTILYPYPVHINRIDYDEPVESEFRVIILDAEQGREREVFLAKDLDNFGDIYTAAERPDDPKYRPETVVTQMVQFVWDKLPRNVLTGAYQTRVTRCIPQFRWDRAHSRPEYLLDSNLHTSWASDDYSDTSAAVELLLNLGEPYTFDRISVATSAAGARMDLFAALGNIDEAYSYVGTILDIGAPVNSNTEVLTVNAGVSQANPDRVYVADTSGFRVGEFVQVADTTNTVGEFREVIKITATYLQLSHDLALDYATTASAYVTQANILCPGGYVPWLVGVYCVGPHILGAVRAEDAFVLPSTTAQFIKARITNLPVDANGNYNVRLHKLSVNRAETIS